MQPYTSFIHPSISLHLIAFLPSVYIRMSKRQQTFSSFRQAISTILSTIHTPLLATPLQSLHRLLVPASTAIVVQLSRLRLQFSLQFTACSSLQLSISSPRAFFAFPTSKNLSLRQQWPAVAAATAAAAAAAAERVNQGLTRSVKFAEV